MKLFSIFVVMFTVACGSEKQDEWDGIFDNERGDTSWSKDQYFDMTNDSPDTDYLEITQVLKLARNYVDVDGMKVDITVGADPWQVYATYCDKEYEACTYYNEEGTFSWVYTPWSDYWGDWRSALPLAHELMHVWLKQITGDGDHNHGRTDLFGQDGVAYKIASDFVAWKNNQ